MKGAKVLDVRAVRFELEVEIEAPRARVWEALVDETNAWWLPDFHMVGAGSVVTLDCAAGGHLIERRPDGASLLWYTTLLCSPGERLILSSTVAHEWGGPAANLLDLRVVERGGGCALAVGQEMFGHVTDETLESLDQGWRGLFSDGLKRYVEVGVRHDTD